MKEGTGNKEHQEAEQIARGQTGRRSGAYRYSLVETPLATRVDLKTDRKLTSTSDVDSFVEPAVVSIRVAGRVPCSPFCTQSCEVRAIHPAQRLWLCQDGILFTRNVQDFQSHLAASTVLSDSAETVPEAK